MLRMEEVFTEYDGIPMLRGVSISVEKSKITCLLGPNGAGKSTIIKTILGFVRPTKGHILFKNRQIDQLKTNQIVNLGISIVPEGRGIFPKMTTYENLRIGIFHEKNTQTILQKMEEVFSIFPALKKRLRQVAGTLSGGEQTMVSIGRALMGNPYLILLDEPSLGLAPILVEQFFEKIVEINKRGITILISEQNAAKSLSIAHYGYVLQKGGVVAEGIQKVLMETDIIKKVYLKS
jgi:branched-chain amino acid transport system ATP-binding protein